MVEFREFPKIARLSREVIITEKIDGTNAQIFILGPDEVFPPYSLKLSETTHAASLVVGSRTRWITPESDNHGFAQWAYDHAEELVVGLGPGRHFGEWWGSGINRGYGLPKGEKRFSLFNTIRWCRHGEIPQRIETQDLRIEKYQKPLPACCDLVPVILRGIFDTYAAEDCLEILRTGGSFAAPGFMNPEGIVIYHIAGNIAFKKTLGNDGHKGGGNG